MIDANGIAQQYIAIWNEQDTEQRRHLISGAFAEEARYVDPLANVAGHDGINTLIGAVQQQFAGHRFTLRGVQDAHHDVIRFSWALAANGANPVACGTDMATIGEDGRLRNVIGFLDGAPRDAGL